MAQFQRNDKGIGYLTLSLAELIKYSGNIEPICDNCGRKLHFEEQITLIPICNEAFCKECGAERLSAVRDYVEDRPIRKHREDFYKEWFNITEEDDGKVTVVFDVKGSERDLNGSPCSKADYTYTIDNGILCIVDLDKGNRSVTNDIENVLADIEAAEGRLCDLKGIIYKDSMGIWSRVLIIDGLVHFKTLSFPSKKTPLSRFGARRGEKIYACSSRNKKGDAKMSDWRNKIVANYIKKDFDMHDTKCGILKLGKEYMAVTLTAYGMFETLGEAEQYMSEWGYEKEKAATTLEVSNGAN